MYRFEIKTLKEMFVHSQILSLILFLTILITASCKKDECNFHYSRYSIDFSDESKQQIPFLEKDSIIIQSIFGFDTMELKKDLAGEGTRKSVQLWQCASDSTISDKYDFYYIEKVVHFKSYASPYTVAMSLINCPDLYEPNKYSEYFELLVATNFNTAFGDHLRLIRFITNERDASCRLTPLGEFNEELKIGNVNFKNVWYNEGDFSNHHFEVFYSTEVGLIGYFIDSLPYFVIGVF